MTYSPNHIPAHTEAPQISDTVRNLYSLESVDEWRSNESLRLGWLRSDSIESGTYSDEYVAVFRDSIEDNLDEFLATKGIYSSDGEYDELRALYRNSSIDRVNESEWSNSPASRGVDMNDTQSHREKLGEHIRQWHEAHMSGVPDENIAEGERTAEVIETELTEARDVWSSLQAKRQGRLFDWRIAGYNTAKERYEQLVQELGRHELAIVINDDSVADDRKNQVVLKYLFDEQKELRDRTVAKLQGTRIGKFVTWMNSGNVWLRAAKAIGLGAAAGGVGAVAGVITGGLALGAGVAMAGGAVVAGSSRFVRGYVAHDRRGMRQDVSGLEAMYGKQTENMAEATNENRMSHGLAVTNELFERDTQKEQIKRRKALAWGVGSVAVGVAAGLGLGMLAERAADISRVIPDNTVTNREELPHIGTAAPDPDKVTEAFSEQAQFVERGEGGWQTLKEMGVPRERWEEAWKAAGNALHESDGYKNVVYKMADGRWGWSRPGELSDGALNIMAEAVQKYYQLGA